MADENTIEKGTQDEENTERPIILASVLVMRNDGEYLLMSLDEFDGKYSREGFNMQPIPGEEFTRFVTNYADLLNKNIIAEMTAQKVLMGMDMILDQRDNKKRILDLTK